MASGYEKITEHRYSWKNQDDKVAGMKIARIMYFKPWDRIIHGSNETAETAERGKVCPLFSALSAVIF